MFTERFSVSMVPDMAELALSTSSPEANVSAIIAGDGWQRPIPGLTPETASPSISEIIELIGEDAAHLLCNHFGGIQCTFAAFKNEFEAALGKETADKLRAYWGEGRFYIPLRALSSRVRYDLVRRLASEGHTRRSIARRLRMTERHIYRILSAA